MTARRVWLCLIVLILAVVAVCWAVTTGPGATHVTPEAEVAATASSPAPSASVAMPSPGNDGRKAPQPKPSIWRKPNHVVAGDGTAAVPSRYQIAGVKRVQTGRDFKDWMSHFSKQDQEVLRSFDKRFYGVYQGRNAGQIAWMAAHGYPMPEDVLAAKFIETPRLRDMVKRGNIKAAFLLKDRELSEIAKEMEAEHKRYGQVLNDNPQLQHDNDMLRYMITASDSPYRAFMSARSSALVGASHPQSIDGDVIGALYWAKLLGDRGASGMIGTFLQSSPNADVLSHRQAVRLGASSLYNHFLIRSDAKAGLPDRDCIQLFGGNDPYPSGISHD